MGLCLHEVCADYLAFTAFFLRAISKANLSAMPGVGINSPSRSFLETRGPCRYIPYSAPLVILLYVLKLLCTVTHGLLSACDEQSQPYSYTFGVGTILQPPYANVHRKFAGNDTAPLHPSGSMCNKCPSIFITDHQCLSFSWCDTQTKSALMQGGDREHEHI